MSLVVEHVFLEIARQRSLLRQIGLAQHLVVEIDLLGVIEISIVCRIDRTRQVPLQIDERVDHALAVAVQADLKIAVAQCFKPWTDRQHPLGHRETDLAPLILGMVAYNLCQLYHRAEPIGLRILHVLLWTQEYRLPLIGYQNGRSCRNLCTCLRSLRSRSANPRSCHPSTTPAMRAIAIASSEVCSSANSSCATLTSLA